MRLERKRACGHCGARAWHPAPTPLRYVIAFGPSQSLSSPNACVGRRVWRTAASCDAVGLLVILWCSSLQRMVRVGATAVVCRRRRAVHATGLCARGCCRARPAVRGLPATPRRRCAMWPCACVACARQRHCWCSADPTMRCRVPWSDFAGEYNAIVKSSHAGARVVIFPAADCDAVCACRILTVRSAAKVAGPLLSAPH